MAKVLLVIGAVFATTVTRSEGAVLLPNRVRLFQQSRTYDIDCQMTDQTNFVAWRTPAKPAHSGQPAIPSERITTITTGRRRVDVVGNNYRLKIESVTADDGGEYECIGSNDSDTFTANVDFTVTTEKTDTLELGKTDKINFGISSYPLLSYTWSKDGEKLAFNARRTLDPYTGDITMRPVQVDDEGNYTCTVSNILGNHNFEAISVTVIDVPRLKKTVEPVRRRLTVGYNNTFNCVISSGLPTPTIEWYFGWTTTEKKVDRNYDARFSHPSAETWTITGVETKDIGRYRCIATNQAGADSLRFEITQVDVPPTIEPISDIIVDEGADYVLDCKVSGSPLPSVEWLKDGRRYRDQRSTTEGNMMVQKIRFTNMQWLDSGTYTCKAKNGAVDNEENEIRVEKTISVNVNSPPRLISSDEPVYTFEENNKNETILCEFSGYPVPLVIMVNENGTEVARGNKSALLVIPGANSTDAFGTYNCTATNSLGRKTSLLQLLRATVPGSPRQVNVMTTCKDISVVWVNPENNGGLEITNYVIRLQAQNDSELHQMTVDGSLRKADITYKSFQAETSYKVALWARNEVGYGPQEMMDAATKKYCKPGKPQITNTEREVDSDFTLTWSRPSDDGGDNTITYKVTWRKKPSTGTTVVDEKENIGETEQLITDLQAGAEYEFNVSARNTVGYSEPDTMFFTVKSATVPPGKTPTFQTTSASTPAMVSETPTTTIVPASGEPTNLTSTMAIGPDVEGTKKQGLGSGAIAGIVIAVILIVLITIDLFCCFFNSCGLIFCCHQALCVGAVSKKNAYKDGKATEMEKKPLPEHV